MSTLEISRLAIYPVKSMKGIELDRSKLTQQGLEHDRRWMVVRENDRFVTQRDLSAMALIHTRLDEEGLLLSRDGFGHIRVQFDATTGQAISTRVWDDDCDTLDEGAQISDWLTTALGSDEKLRLVRMAPGFIRPQSRWQLLGKDTRTLFADAAPFLVTNEASLDFLNRTLESRGLQPVPMNRFRPNIVVRGCAAFEEHSVAELTGESYRIGLCYPCQRCVMTTIDQSTAERKTGWQPYRTLVDINPMPGKENAPAFGQNAILAKGQGETIRVGDRLEFN